MVERFNVVLHPGRPLGMTVQRAFDGTCVIVSQIGNSGATIGATPRPSAFRDNDVIVSLNGITLAEVEGGVSAWITLFSAFESVERNVVVLRRDNSLGKEVTTTALTTGNDETKVPPSLSLPSKEVRRITSSPLRDSTKHNSAKRLKSRKSGQKNEIISLLDDSDDDASSGKEGGVAVSAAAATTTAAAATTSAAAATTRLVNHEEDDDDDDVMEDTNSASQWRNASSALPTTSNATQGNLKDDRNYSTNDATRNDHEEEEELTIVATKGQNALMDFPHSRENCATHPFATSINKAVHCSNCYCYVCDVLASECVVWSLHCNASHNDRKWRSERESAKRRVRDGLPPVANRTQSATTAAPRSLSALLAAYSTTSPSRTTAIRAGPRPAADYSVRNLLQRLTIVHPVEMQPPVGGVFVTPLRHYQKQSLAFMVDCERTANRGGWLCDEVGMGKTAVVLALVVTNPAVENTLTKKQQFKAMKNKIDSDEERRNDIELAYFAKKDQLEEEDIDYHEYMEKKEVLLQDMQKQLAEVGTDQLIKLKTTIVFTSLSLMGQWEDEWKKHAPGLVVKTFHHSRKKYDINSIQNLTIPILSEIDVIISSTTFKWPTSITQSCQFHRVIQDESHLYSGGSKVDNANRLTSPLRWGVTATPMTSSVKELANQLFLVEGSRIQTTITGGLRTEMKNFCSSPSEGTFNRLVDSLQSFMIRHMKSQQINGSEALCLPPSTSSTIMLDMSRLEDLAFNCINISRLAIGGNCSSGAKRFAADRAFLPQMSKILNSPQHYELSEVYNKKKDYLRRYIPQRLTKVVALRKSLAEQRRIDPVIRAVVFTQFLDVHSACVRGLQGDGFDLYQFTGSSSTNQRDNAIRSFQDVSIPRPAVFVITLRSGNVGITLTAASRVYLMEPNLDPAVEVQAAGRIHRLGQDKPCHVVKFAFNNSYESNVIDLHREINAGRISIIDGFVPPEAWRILTSGLRFRTEDE